MPNTPALVQAAASVLAQGTCTMPDDGELVKELLQCIGICEEGTENLLDAVTGLSGSGPAYVSSIIYLGTIIRILLLTYQVLF